MRGLILGHFSETANYCMFDPERIANVFNNLFYANHTYSNLEECDYRYPKMIVHDYNDHWNVNITVAIVDHVNGRENILWISRYVEILNVNIPSKLIVREEQKINNFDPMKW